MSIFRYPGGKSKRSIRDKIGQFFSDFSEFRAPFVGGGGMYFGIHPHDVKSRWINDINSGLMAVYWALRDRPKKFIVQCREIDGDSDVLKDKFKELSENDFTDPALRYYFINRTVWGGRVNYDIPSRLYFSNPAGWKIVKTNKLAEAARCVKNTRITCGDYLPLLEESSSNDVLIYCDPPYVSNSEMSRTDQQYQHNFSIADHSKFANHVSKCSHKVCISYDDHELVRELFKDFNMYPITWKYSGSSLSKKKTGRELVITNY